MALHDYYCPSCGWRLNDQFRPISIGAQADPPICFNCDTPMSWIPQVGRMDLLSDADGDHGTKFTVYDGQNNPVEIDSFAKMRKLERESNQQYRNGEGQPMRFRALHQHKSNMDRNTYGDIPAPEITDSMKRKFGRGGGAEVLRAGEGGAAPDVPFGPGVSDNNASALKE